MTQKPKVPADRTKHSAAPRDDHPPSDRVHEIRKGGIQPDPGDPMKHEPLEESYGRHSGRPSRESGAPKEIVRPEKGGRNR
jgi:hypothetical protein